MRYQREAFGEQVRMRQQEFADGRGSLDILLEAQRFWSSALSQESQAIVSYNNSLASFDFARGAMLQRHKVLMKQSVASDVVPSETLR